MKLFRKRPYIPIAQVPASKADNQKPIVPEGLWEKCELSKDIIYSKDLGKDKVCPHCAYNFGIPAYERISSIVDEGTLMNGMRSCLKKIHWRFPGMRTN